MRGAQRGLDHLHISWRVYGADQVVKGPLVRALLPAIEFQSTFRLWCWRAHLAELFYSDCLGLRICSINWAVRRIPAERASSPSAIRIQV